MAINKKIALLVILFSLATRLFGQTAAKGLEGTWQGTLDAGEKLRLVLTVSKASDGAYSGKIDSLDQGASIPIEVITVKGDLVNLELKTVGAAFEGTLNADRSELTGKFSQGGGVLPLTFKRSGEAIAQAQTAKPAAPQRPIDVPVDVMIPVRPTEFKGGGKTHLCYELHMTNFGRTDCVLTRVEVIGTDSNKKVFAVYDRDELGNRVVRPGLSAATTQEKLKLGAGLRLVTHLWLTLDGAEAPASIQHRLSFKVGDYPEELSIECARAIISKSPVVISPPLRGGGWLAANGPSNTSGHRRALIPIGGGAHIAQRFAIDFVQLREDGRTYTGDQKDNRNYRCYGTEALAVAKATVVGVKDGIPENVPGANSRAVPITLETVGGNHVVLDLGNGKFAFYAHLQPGSLRVKPGDTVHSGQVLGLVGNSGNSTEPHLHFHISDASSPLGSEGLPYVFSSFEVEGRGWGWKPGSPNSTIEKRALEMPLDLEVIRFSSAR
jgi:murein DD-endopeptidase MepM/ murein hydrolase activator NlpD